MTVKQIFIAADQALFGVIKQIKPDHWSLKLPDWFQVGSSQDRASLDLRQIINYHAYDEAWVPQTLAGKTVAEVGSRYDGDLLGADPAAAYAKLMPLAAQAVTTADLAKIVHLSYGDWSAEDYLLHTTSFRLFRAFDIAKLIGADAELAADLVQAAWDIYSPHFAEWRQMGVFAATVPVPADASLQDKLIAATGRHPH